MVSVYFLGFVWVCRVCIEPSVILPSLQRGSTEFAEFGFGWGVVNCDDTKLSASWSRAHPSLALQSPSHGPPGHAPNATPPSAASASAARAASAGDNPAARSNKLAMRALSAPLLLLLLLLVVLFVLPLLLLLPIRCARLAMLLLLLLRALLPKYNARAPLTGSGLVLLQPAPAPPPAIFKLFIIAISYIF